MLKRSYARAFILMNRISLAVFLVAYYYLRDDFDKKIFCLYIMLAWSVVMILFRCIFLRCPHCKKVVAPLQWSGNGTKYCKNCGKPLEYDR